MPACQVIQLKIWFRSNNGWLPCVFMEQVLRSMKCRKASHLGWSPWSLHLRRITYGPWTGLCRHVSAWREGEVAWTSSITPSKEDRPISSHSLTPPNSPGKEGSPCRWRHRLTSLVPDDRRAWGRLAHLIRGLTALTSRFPAPATRGALIWSGSAEAKERSPFSCSWGGGRNQPSEAHPGWRKATGDLGSLAGRMESELPQTLCLGLSIIE